MERHSLSKSTFMRGVQCLKSLYLYKKRYFLRDKLTPEQKAKFARGINVGIIARELFPGGVDASPKTPFQYPQSVAKTAELIDSGEKVIYEAAFQFEKVLVALDILVNKNGKWYAYEVKSSLKISDTYLMDASLQHYVITHSGLPLEDIGIIYLNKDYVMGNELDISRLFTVWSVKEEALKNRPFIENKIEAEKSIIQYKHSPKIDIGPQCHDPYPCDFRGHCWKHVPPVSVFDLNAFSREEQFDLYYNGILEIEKIPKQKINTPAKRIQVNSHLQNREYLDKDGLKNFLMQIEQPLMVGKLLVMRSAVPLHQGNRPYESIPFHFSGILNASGHNNQFIEISCMPGEKPDVFAGKLVKALHEAKTILFYDMQDARKALEYAGANYAPLKQPIEEVIHRSLDLKQVIDQNIFYHPNLMDQPSINAFCNFFGMEKEYKALEVKSDSMAEVKYAGLFHDRDEKKTGQYFTWAKQYGEINTGVLQRFYHYLNQLL